MYKIQVGSIPKTPLIVGFDVEWTKNYRVKNGNRPFCFSLIWVPLNFTNPVDIHLKRFGVIGRYIDHTSEEQRLIHAADRLVGLFMQKRALFVGHQFISDISVLLGAAKHTTPHLQQLREAWRNRKISTIKNVFDTRFDLVQNLPPKSRRLVDVCQTHKVDVTQPELQGSMTRMQKKYAAYGDSDIRDKLMTLNFRHSLSSVVLYRLHARPQKTLRNINLNTLLFNNLHEKIPYIDSLPSILLSKGQERP